MCCLKQSVLSDASRRALAHVLQPDESPFINGKVTHKITVVPTANLTVNCTVYNEFGVDTKAINVSSCKYAAEVNSSPLSLPLCAFAYA